MAGREELARAGALASVAPAGARRPVSSVLALVIAAACLFDAGSRPAHADTLSEALSSAYRLNPQIDAERARLRATDEGVARAMSGYRPTITSQFSVSRQGSNTVPDSAGEGTANPKNFRVDLVQPLFRGFQTVNAVSEAEANVRAGQQNLRAVEQSVLQEAATTYVDVVRDGAILKLREANLEFLSRELQATQDRFNVGEVTRTDVAQANARRSAAVSAITLARANLRASEARYRRVVGVAPNALREPPVPNALVPNTLEAAIDIAIQQHPAVVQALYLEQAAKHVVDRIFGELLPQAQLEASYSKTRDPGPTTELSEQGVVTGRVTIPLYEAGETRARLRQAKHTHVSRIQEIEQARTEVREAVIRAWSLFRASQSQLTSDQAQVDANRIALEGVREEERVGQRTLLDVLNAQQDLLNAQVQLTTTRRDIVANAYALLSSIGALDGASYGAATTVYDPDVHYHEVRREWWRISITDNEGRHSDWDLWEHFGSRKVYK